MFNLLELKGSLDKKGIFLYFYGPVSQELLVQLGGMLKQKMKTAEVKSNTILKVFSMLVEQAQNVIHYASAGDAENAPEAENSRQGALAVGYDGEDFFVASGNEVEQAEVGAIREKLEKIRVMDRDQLKALYKEIRRSEITENSKGAGLGLVEMARHADKPIEYEFTPLNDQVSFFTLVTLIRGE